MRSFKKSTRALFLFLFLFLFLAFALSKYEKEIISGGIELEGCQLINLHQVDVDVYRSDQPDANDFKLLEEYGIREVLNLRRYNSDDEKAQGTSLVLHHVPVQTHAIKEEQLVEAMRIIRDRKGPILIHCFHGSNRTGSVAALYQMVFRNMPKDEAIENMLKGGYGYHKIYSNIPRLLQQIDVEKLQEELGVSPF